ncbi:alanine racemase [Streptomyces sp. NPDC051133]|uniref:alanine racemase n=1 Tax=Streptomyces sp. NPDC051133 TaxID=3155521 RepID=UPI00343E2F24
MALTLYVDEVRWRTNQAAAVQRFPGLMPVVCGNGFGFGLEWLAEEARRLDADGVAVGTVYEAVRMKDLFSGSVLVLTPFRQGEKGPPLPLRVIRTVSSVEGLRSLPGMRVVVQVRAHARMGGVRADDLHAVRSHLSEVRFEGFALHVPETRRAGYNAVEEVSAWMGLLRQAGLPLHTFYVSHLTAEEFDFVCRDHPRTRFRACTGRRLWLGDPGAIEYRSEVLQVARAARGDRFGLRQLRVPVDGCLVMVAGGTAHGVGLEPLRAMEGVARVKGVAHMGLSVVNQFLSPFVWGGQRCWFAEPPDQLASVLFLPAEVPVPGMGTELTARLAATLTRADRVVLR